MEAKTAVITGASSGIGAATALRLAGSYEGLVLHARKSADALDRVAKAVEAKGTRVVTVLGDLADATVPPRLAKAADDGFGRLDALVANAGFPILKSFEEGGPADIDYAFRGNASSFFALSREAAPLLARSPAGRIVAVGSFTSHLFRNDFAQFPMSAASKGALEIAVRSLALHFAGKGVTVNCVVPGLVRKEAGTDDGLSDEAMREGVSRIPLGRAGEPGEVAGAIAFLLSADAAYITGQSLHVNGGLVI